MNTDRHYQDNISTHATMTCYVPSCNSTLHFVLKRTTRKIWITIFRAKRSQPHGLPASQPEVMKLKKLAVCILRQESTKHRDIVTRSLRINLHSIYAYPRYTCISRNDASSVQISSLVLYIAIKLGTRVSTGVDGIRKFQYVIRMQRYSPKDSACNFFKKIPAIPLAHK